MAVAQGVEVLINIRQRLHVKVMVKVLDWRLAGGS